jgi:hypothetical protein
MPANYVLLERIELNASAASVTFSNIPQSGYTDLIIKCSARSAASQVYDQIRMAFNGTMTASFLNLTGDGSGVSGEKITGQSTIKVTPGVGATATANTFSNDEIYIPNYTGSANKSVSSDAVGENNATTAYAVLTAGLNASTTAINTITLTNQSGSSFVQYSTFSLYGLAAVGTTPTIAPKALGGNITTDGTYWIHTFLTTGAFVPAVGLTCDYLVVAGGGGGGGSTVNANAYGGGGAGAGGFLTGTSLSVSATPYTITVGAGGAGGASASSGTQGGNSTFSSVTSTGGGFGAGGTLAAVNGGSGGSGGASTNGGTSGAASPSGQGNAGATSSVTFGSSGGGGGASAAGTGVTNVNGGAGGAGTANSYSGSSITYAGGGGGGGYYLNGTGGAGGSGGGGAGGNATPSAATAGTVNRGGGGGGGGNSSGVGTVGANGGSGIVIIRYVA